MKHLPSLLLILSLACSKSEPAAPPGGAPTGATPAAASTVTPSMAESSGQRCLDAIGQMAALDGKPEYGSQFPVTMGLCTGACSVGHKPSCEKFDAEFKRFCAKYDSLCNQICKAQQAGAARNPGGQMAPLDPCVKYLADKAAAQ